MNINMKYLLVAAFIGALLLVCTNSSIIGITAYAQQSQTQSTLGHFVAHLSGTNLSPPINTTASGQATLNLTSQGSKMAYIIKAHGLDQVKSAALEYTLNGQARDIILLYDGVKSGHTGKINGMFVNGIFGASSLLGEFKGKQLSDLINAITEGKVFLRVSTTSLPLGQIGGKVTLNTS
jgi:CHRD domain